MNTPATGSRLERKTIAGIGNQKQGKNAPVVHAGVNACPLGPIASIQGILIGHQKITEELTE